MSAIPLDAVDLAIAATLVVLNGALSIALQLGLARELAIATARMVVQLLLVGLVLVWLFEAVSALWTGLTVLVMILFAGYEIVARQERRLAGLWAYGLGTTTMLVAAALVTVFALTTQIRPDPWFHPRYGVPLLGMVLGNTMTGISLGLHTLTSGLARDRAGVEAQLALGATRWRALHPAIRSALRSAFMPIVNAMAATGLVALPGMMTGQILAGADPVDAVRYQIVIMFMIASAAALGAFGVVFFAYHALFDDRHRLRLDRVRKVDV